MGYRTRIIIIKWLTNLVCANSISIFSTQDHEKLINPVTFTQYTNKPERHSVHGAKSASHNQQFTCLEMMIQTTLQLKQTIFLH